MILCTLGMKSEPPPATTTIPGTPFSSIRPLQLLTSILLSTLTCAPPVSESSDENPHSLHVQKASPCPLYESTFLSIAYTLHLKKKSQADRLYFCKHTSTLHLQFSEDQNHKENDIQNYSWQEVGWNQLKYGNLRKEKPSNLSVSCFFHNNLELTWIKLFSEAICASSF